MKKFNPKFHKGFECIGGAYFTTQDGEGNSQNCSAYLINTPEIKSEYIQAINALPELLKLLNTSRQIYEHIKQNGIPNVSNELIFLFGELSGRAVVIDEKFGAEE